MPVADALLRVLHDIDVLKGRECGNCRFGRRNRHGIKCQHEKGYDPLGPEDGCDDWTERHEITAA